MTALFAGLAPAPPDSILGLMEAFRADPSPAKINLAAGVFVDETGRTPVLATVAEAERRILDHQVTKLYKPIAGDPAFLSAVRELVFGPANPAVTEGRIEVVHTPGGTGALRVAGDLVRRVRPDAAVWLSVPTWPNHPQVFEATGLAVRPYPYLDPSGTRLDLAAMLRGLRDAGPGDVVVLHACCHNPSGVDPRPAEWREIGHALADIGVLPLLDFAYQGFADGLTEDATGVLELTRQGRTLFVASSFSKNFALYDERVGALSIVGSTATEAQTLLSHAKMAVRANYSNPPAHGGEVVATVLLDPELRRAWVDEVAAMRERINGNRRRFVEGLSAAGVPGDLERFARQRGMFSLLGLTPEQVARLRDEFHVYVVGRGRVNVAGLTDQNLEPACAAIAAVIRD